MLTTNSLHRGVLLLMCLALNAFEAAAEPLKEYKRALVDYYGAASFHPLMTPQGYRVGDVIDAQTQGTVLSQEDCFPELRIESSTGNVSLPSFMKLEHGASAFWARILRTLGMNVTSESSSLVFLYLDDVTVESVSLGALRDALDARCSDLQPVFQEDRMPQTMGRTVNIIAGILKARVNTIFSFSDEVQANANLEGLARSLGDAARPPSDLPAQVASALGLSGRTSFVVAAANPQAVAYRPATIFRPRLSAEVPGRIRVDPFDPENPTHRERLLNLARAWEENSHDPTVGN